MTTLKTIRTRANRIERLVADIEEQSTVVDGVVSVGDALRNFNRESARESRVAFSGIMRTLVAAFTAEETKDQ